MSQKIYFVDLEASGLHPGSYPIEIGWTDVDVNVESHLIHPHPSWTIQLWNFDSQKIHNIYYDRLFVDGRDLTWIANRCNELFEGNLIGTDSPRFDDYWTNRLYESAGIQRKFGYVGSDGILLDLAMERNISVEEYNEMRESIRLKTPHTHRAGDDVKFYGEMAKALISRK